MWKAALYDYFWQLSCDLYYICIYILGMGGLKRIRPASGLMTGQRGQALTRLAMSHGSKSFPQSCAKFLNFFSFSHSFFFLLFCVSRSVSFQLLVSAAFELAFQSFPILLQVFRKKWHTICQQNVAYQADCGEEGNQWGGGDSQLPRAGKINCKLGTSLRCLWLGQ